MNTKLSSQNVTIVPGSATGVGAQPHLQGGRIAPCGEFPLNTPGGGLSFNHGGMFGMPLMIESVRKLRGNSGERQVKGARNCLVQAGGLVMSPYIGIVLGTQA